MEFLPGQEVESHAKQNEGTAPVISAFKDLDGNGIIDQNDRTIIGNPTPDFTHGFNYRIEIQKHRNWVCLLKAARAMTFTIRLPVYDFTYVNRPSSVLERWTGPGTSNRTQGESPQQIPIKMQRVSDRFCWGCNYNLRLKTLQLSYYLPTGLLNKVKLGQVKVYVSAQNLIPFTNYSGYDPEIRQNINGSLEIGIDRAFTQCQNIYDRL